MNNEKKIKKVRLRHVAVLLLLMLAALPAKAQFYSVQTNVAKLATTSFYVQGSMTLNLKWSAHLGMEYNPWTFRDNKKIKNFTVTPGVRYWMNQSYVGSFISMNALYSRYNFTHRGYRYDGNGGGMTATFGYAWPLGLRWNVEVEGGGGFLWGKHHKYDCARCGTRYGVESRAFFLPQLGVNFVYLF